MNGLRTAFLAALLFLTTARACPAGPLDRVRQAFVDVSVMSYAPDGEATERFVRYSDYGRANDVLLLQLYTSVHLPDGEVRRRLTRLLHRYDLPTAFRCGRDDLCAVLAHDKKAGADGITTVRVPEIGRFTLQKESTDDILGSCGEVISFL